MAEDFQVAVQTAEADQDADSDDLTFEPHKHHLPAADLIIREWYTDPSTGTQVTIHSSTLGDFLWNGRHYQQLQAGDVVSRVIWRFGTHPRFRPSHAQSIATAILAKRLTSRLPPCWLDGSDRGHALVLANGIYCVDQREFIPHTPDLFALCGATFAFQAHATCPTWLRFLDSIWPGCPATVRELQKWFGYNLVPSYRYHKLALLVGAKRGGSACPGITPTECAACPADSRPPKPCGVATASGGQGTTRTRHALGPDPGQVSITYQMYSVPDRLDCYYKGVLVATTAGLVSGTGTLTWAYNPAPGDPQWCLVIVSAPQSGTAWAYTIGCPVP